MDAEPLAVPQTTSATITNGSAAPGGWRKVTFGAVTGSGASVNGAGDLAFTATGPASIGVAITAEMASEGQGALGFSWNGGSISALGSLVSLAPETPVQLTGLINVNQIGATLQVYVFATNVESDPLTYTNGGVSIRWALIFPADASAPDYSATPPMPIDPGGNPTTPVVVPGPAFPPQSGGGSGNNPYVLVLPVFAWLPLAIGTIINKSAIPPFIGTNPPANVATPPPMLTTTRTPPFPAYPA